MENVKHSLSKLFKEYYPTILGFVLVLITGFMTWNVIKSQAPTIPVVVANNTIRVGETITEDNVAVVDYPASMVPLNTYKSLSQVQGKTITGGPVIQGAMIFTENISSYGSLRAIAATYAPVKQNSGSVLALEPSNWVIAALPVEYPIKGLERGDYVDIYTEAQSPNINAVGPLISHALIIEIPGDDCSTYVVAVREEYATSVAKIAIRKMPIALILPMD